jgi:hypothetical protein
MNDQSIALLETWLENTKGLTRVLAIEGGTQSISENEVRELALTCKWANDEDKDWHHGLIIGCGDLFEYCQSCGKSENSKAYFLNAYES